MRPFYWMWISVNEKMPPKGMRVLCACRANIYAVMKWDGIDWVENPTHVYMRSFVTHWAPLPHHPDLDEDFRADVLAERKD